MQKTKTPHLKNQLNHYRDWLWEFPIVPSTTLLLPVYAWLTANWWEPQPPWMMLAIIVASISVSSYLWLGSGMGSVVVNEFFFGCFLATCTVANLAFNSNLPATLLVTGAALWLTLPIVLAALRDVETYFLPKTFNKRAGEKFFQHSKSALIQKNMIAELIETLPKREQKTAEQLLQNIPEGCKYPQFKQLLSGILTTGNK